MATKSNPRKNPCFDGTCDGDQRYECNKAGTCLMNRQEKIAQINALYGKRTASIASPTKLRRMLKDLAEVVHRECTNERHWEESLKIMDATAKEILKKIDQGK